MSPFSLFCFFIFSYFFFIVFIHFICLSIYVPPSIHFFTYSSILFIYYFLSPHPFSFMHSHFYINFFFSFFLFFLLLLFILFYLLFLLFFISASLGLTPLKTIFLFWAPFPYHHFFPLEALLLKTYKNKWYSMTAHDLQPSIFLHNYHPYLFHLFFPQNGLKVNKAISFHFSFVFGGFLYFLSEFLSLFFVLACLSSIGMCGLACYAERTHILFFWHNQICLKGEAKKQKIQRTIFYHFFFHAKGTHL